GGDRHDEDIAERARLLEVHQVADVHEVEGAVTLDDPTIAEPRPQRRQIRRRHDLVRPEARAGRDGPSGEPPPRGSSTNICTVSAEKSFRSLPTSVSFLRMSFVTVMMGQPSSLA